MRCLGLFHSLSSFLALSLPLLCDPTSVAAEATRDLSWDALALPEIDEPEELPEGTDEGGVASGPRQSGSVVHARGELSQSSVRLSSCDRVGREVRLRAVAKVGVSTPGVYLVEG